MSLSQGQCPILFWKCPWFIKKNCYFNSDLNASCFNFFFLRFNFCFFKFFNFFFVDFLIIIIFKKNVQILRFRQRTHEQRRFVDGGDPSHHHASPDISQYPRVLPVFFSRENRNSHPSCRYSCKKSRLSIIHWIDITYTNLRKFFFPQVLLFP